MTSKEAKAIVRWFQSSIGLSDWSISVTIGEPPEDLGDDIFPCDRKHWMGRCCFKTQFREGSIWVNPDAHDTDGYGTVSSTLFHELLHVFLASCDIESSEPMNEYAVNRLADALDSLYTK